MPAVVLQHLALDIGPRKLLVFRADRPDLPHITISWNNTSGEVDVHATPQGADRATARQPLGRYLQVDVATLVSSIGQQLLAMLQHATMQLHWAVGPRWLARNGYALLKAEGERIIQWLERAAPKRRGKYRLDLRVLKEPPRVALYPPTARYLAAAIQEGLLFALSTKGSDKGRVLILVPLTWSTGSVTWLGIDHHDAQQFASRAKKLFSTATDPLLARPWQQIRKILELHEIGW